MSRVIKDLKRLDVVKHLHDNLKISPASVNYKTEFVNFVLGHFHLKKEEIPPNHGIYQDIINIKSYYKKCNSQYHYFIKKHEKFLDAHLKIKRIPIVPPADVYISSFFNSHIPNYLHNINLNYIY